MTLYDISPPMERKKALRSEVFPHWILKELLFKEKKSSKESILTTTAEVTNSLSEVFHAYGMNTSKKKKKKQISGVYSRSSFC